MVAPGGMHGCSMGGMHGCSQGGMHGCSRGACVFAPGGHVWLLLKGACMVAPGGGMHGCSRGAGDMCGCSQGVCGCSQGVCGCFQGVCVVAAGGGMHGCSQGGMRGDTTRYGDTINERAVRILLQCILVSNCDVSLIL